MKGSIEANKRSIEEPVTEKRENYHSLKKWGKKFSYDFFKKEFIPIKCLFFLIYGANFALVPFLTLQARSLGITEAEIGIIYSCIPLASLLAPTLSGMLADKIGNFRILLSVTTAISGITGLLFVTVPVGRITHIIPDLVSIDITCSSLHGNNILLEELYLCDVNRNFHQFPIDVLNCSSTCMEEESMSQQNYENLLCGNSSNCFQRFEQEYGLVNKTQEDFNVQIYSLHSNDSSEHLYTNRKHSATIHFSRGADHSIYYESDSALCPNYNKKAKSSEYGIDNTSKSRKNCSTICTAVTLRENLCQSNEAIEEINPSITFYGILIIQLLNEFTLAISIPLLEGAAVSILREHNGDFGFQRMYTNVGMMMITPVSGILIDYFTELNGKDDFRPAIAMYCGFKLSAAIVILFLSLDFKQASNRVVRDFSSLFMKPEIILFLFATFFAGTCYGFIETFLFWLLEDLGADKTFMGITVTVGSVFGIPLLMVSTFIIRKLGHVNTIVFGFLVYIIRFTGYTLISNPWWAMPFEAMECMTVSLMSVTFVSYAAILATPSTVVTLQGTYVGLYNGVGRGSGSLLGGYLIENVGTTLTFRIMAAFGGISGIIYFIAYRIFLICQKYKNTDTKTDVENANKGAEAERSGSIKHTNDKVGTDYEMQLGEIFENSNVHFDTIM